MGKSLADYERRERLAYILDMLSALSGVAARDGSPMLSYFVELAAAQARDEYTALDRRNMIDSVSRTAFSLNRSAGTHRRSLRGASCAAQPLAPRSELTPRHAGRNPSAH